jgi:hypothetical protein
MQPALWPPRYAMQRYDASDVMCAHNWKQQRDSERALHTHLVTMVIEWMDEFQQLCVGHNSANVRSENCDYCAVKR